MLYYLTKGWAELGLSQSGPNCGGFFKIRPYAILNLLDKKNSLQSCVVCGPGPLIRGRNDKPTSRLLCKIFGLRLLIHRVFILWTARIGNPTLCGAPVHENQVFGTLLIMRIMIFYWRDSCLGLSSWWQIKCHLFMIRKQLIKKN